MSYTASPERDWDAHCDAMDSLQTVADDEIAACLRNARIAIARPDGLLAAINEAQGDGLLDGETLAALILPVDTAARWKALRRFALEVMTGAVVCELCGAPGKRRSRYGDIGSRQVLAAWSEHDQNALADRLAQFLGHCAGA